MEMLVPMSLDFWKKASPRRKRIIAIILTFVVCVAFTMVGVLTPVGEQEAAELNNELNQTVSSLENESALLQYIFGNNLIITLILFVPFVGPFFGAYVFYNTGNVVAAVATVENISPVLAFIALFLTPVAWLEFLAYSAAFAESVWLAWRILQRRGKREIVNACKFISLCAVLLAVAAVIEVAMIYAVL
jgi:uncharacterized membrane protein SpoIIM required for sporulation